MKAQRGDKQAFGMVVSAFQYSVFRFAFRLLGNEEEARDATQDTFVKAWIKRQSYNPEYQFSTWIYRIAGNVCCDRLRSLKRKKFQPETIADETTAVRSPENIESEIINRELADFILYFTQDLTPKQKLVFMLRDIEGFEVGEVERITGMSGAKIKSNLYLARKYIKAKIEKITS